MRKALRAVLFDFDGTLADSYPAITASVNHVRGLHGLPPLGEPEVRRHVGRGPDHLLRATVGSNDAADVAAYKAHHPSVLRAGTRLMPGASEALETLAGRGLRLAVCSNKPVAFTRELLHILGVADRFALALGPEDVARPKPAPDMLLAALPRLGVTADQALYVGDMTVDVQTARAAGVPVWVVPTGSDDIDALTRAKPDRLLRDLRELAGLLGSNGEAWGRSPNGEGVSPLSH
jgi:2-phosphoglycolate phosphatase